MPSRFLADMERWPDAQLLQAFGDSAHLRDDRGRALLCVRYLYPHLTERYVEIWDQQTQARGVVRFFCPLSGGGTQPHSLQALYNLQGALLRDGNLSLFQPERKFRDYCSPLYKSHLVAESGEGGDNGRALQGYMATPDCVFR